MLRDVHLGRRDLDLAFQEADRLAQVPNRDDLQAGHHGGFGGVLRRDQDADLALLARAQGNGQHAFDHAHRAVEGQFADHDEVLELVALHLFAGGHHADGDGQVEARPFLLHVRRGQVDGGAAEGEAEAGVDQRRHHPVARFLDRGVRQARR